MTSSKRIIYRKTAPSFPSQLKTFIEYATSLLLGIVHPEPPGYVVGRGKGTTLSNKERSIKCTMQELIFLSGPSLYPSWRKEEKNLRILLEEIESLKEKIERIDKKIDDILSSMEPASPERRLLEIPGAGPRTVATFTGEAGDVNRFSSSTELIGFIGWYPKISESGEKISQHPKMSKKESPILSYELPYTWPLLPV